MKAIREASPGQTARNIANRACLGQAPTTAPIDRVAPPPPSRTFPVLINNFHSSNEELDKLNSQLAEFADRLGAAHIPTDPASSGKELDPPSSHYSDLERLVARFQQQIGVLSYTLDRLMAIG